MRRITTWPMAAGLLAAPLAHAALEVGMVAPASGGAAPLGIGMQQGIDTYFAKLNDEGGINGKTISLWIFKVP